MGLTFLNGIFGLALAAVSLPVLIHLLNRRRSRREAFSSLEFLDEITRKQRRRVQVRQWLLLALRCLAIALAALAMMRPALQSGFAGGGSTLGVVVVDPSYSMMAGTESGTHREAAINRVQDVAPLFPRGERAQLLWGQTPPEAAFDTAVQDFGRVVSRVERGDVGYGPFPAREVVQDALRIVGEGGSLNRELYVVSDFQEADWDPSSLPELPEGVRVYLCPVGDGESLPNVSIAGATFVKASVESGGAGAIRVTLANHSDRELGNYPVRVYAGNDLAGEAAVRVPAQGTATADLPLTAVATDQPVLQVRIDEDALATDDVVEVSTGDDRTVRVLLVQGGTPDSAAREPYVRLALDPPGQVGSRLFSVDEIPLRDLAVQADFDYDVFILNNVERLGESVLDRLRVAHRDGAGLFVILGDRVDLRAYNTAVLDGLLDVTLEEPESQTGGFYSLEPEVPGHPLFDGFTVSYGDALTSARFTKIVSIRPGDERVLARFGERPAVIEGDRVLLFASSADLRWGNFPTGGSFLPFLHQAVLNLAAGSGEARQFRAGEPIVIERPVSEIPGEVEAIDPRGNVLPVARSVEGGRVTLRTPPISAPGQVRLVVGDETLETVAVQLNPDEGRLVYADVDGLAEAWGAGVSVLRGADTVRDAVLVDRNGREIWRELLIAALIVLALETVVGRMRFA